jgi:hypothetical protein
MTSFFVEEAQIGVISRVLKGEPHSPRRILTRGLGGQPSANG